MHQFDRIRKIYVEKGNLFNFLLVFLSIVALYHFRFGLGILNPTNFGWLMKNDWVAGYLGWSFYRYEPWGFPIGHLSNYLAPVGTNIGFLEVPGVLIPLKLLSPLLPDQFQQVGWWLFLCHLLLGFFLIRLFDLFSTRGLVQLIAVLIIVFNPVLLHRSIHPNLCVHWLFVAGTWIYFWDARKHSASTMMVYQSVLLLVSGLINPQLCLIQAGFFTCQFLRLWYFDKVLSLKRGFLIGATAFSLLFAVWYVIGFFELQSQGDLGVQGGFGLYSLNLNSLYNSGGWSSILPSYGWVSWHQYESFMYLGVGMIGLTGVVMVAGVGKLLMNKLGKANIATPLLDSQISIIPLALFVAVLTLLAITNVVSFNDRVLFTIGIPHFVQSLGDIVRSTARFFWVTYYLILISSILYFIKLVRNKVILVIVLSAVFAIQLYDYKLLLTSDASTSFEEYHPPISEAKWDRMFAQLDKFILYPPYESEYLTFGDYRYFCYLAAKHHKPITLGYSGRVDNKALSAYSQKLKRSIDEGLIDKRALYICTSEFIGKFMVAYQAGLLGCGKLDGYYFFYPKYMENDPAFTGFRSEIPSSLLRRSVFTAFLPGMTDKEVDLPITIDRLERSPHNVFLDGWIPNDPTGTRTAYSILLRSNENKVFATAEKYLLSDSISLGRNGVLDSIRFSGTYFLDGLVPGNYDVGLYVGSIQGKDLSGVYSYFGKINVGFENVFQPIESDEVPQVRCWVDVFEETDDEIEVGGWAFIPGQSSFSNRIEIVLKSDNRIYHAPTDPNLRPDVTNYFGSPHNLSTSGFSSFISKKGLEKGTYEVGIRVINEKTHQEGIQYMGRTFSIK